MIIEDKRKITHLWYEDDSCTSIKDQEIKIVPYHENGEMAPVVWFEIRDKDGNVQRRINSKYVTTVVYEDKK